MNDRFRRLSMPAQKMPVLPTPAQWAARLQQFREIVSMSDEVEQLRERVAA